MQEISVGLLTEEGRNTDPQLPTAPIFKLLVDEYKGILASESFGVQGSDTRGPGGGSFQLLGSKGI